MLTFLFHDSNHSFLKKEHGLASILSLLGKFTSILHFLPDKVQWRQWYSQIL